MAYDKPIASQTRADGRTCVESPIRLFVEPSTDDKGNKLFHLMLQNGSNQTIINLNEIEAMALIFNILKEGSENGQVS